MSSVFSITKCHDTIFPRVKDLENCQEWIQLTYNINNLKRIESQWLNDVKHKNISGALSLQHQHKALQSSHQMTKACTVSEISEPSLVYVHMTTNDHLLLNMHNNIRTKHLSWQLSNKFEDNYFKNKNNAIYIDKILPNGVVNSQAYCDSIVNCGESGIKVEDGDENRKSSTVGSVLTMDSQSFFKHKVCDKNHCNSAFEHQYDKTDILFHPGSNEFRGSRERLHEIFKHNRLLRQRFFAETPMTNSGVKNISTKMGINVTNTTINTPSNINNTFDEVEMIHLKDFDSAEMLTNQTNGSDVNNSTNEHKTHKNFLTLPESILNIDQDNPTGNNKIYKPPSNTPLSLLDIKSKNDKLISNSNQNINQSTNELVSLEYNQHLPYHTPPARISNCTNNRLISLSDHAEPVDYTYRHGNNIEEKFYATCVKIIEESPVSKLSSLKKQRNIPPPLDLTNVNKIYNEVYEQERNMMRNYTVELLTSEQHNDKEEEEKEEEEHGRYTTVTAVDNDSISNKNLNDQDNIKFTLRSSKSLVELSNKFRPIFNNDTKKNYLKIKHENNQSFTDLSTLQNLLSPQLVNNLSNSTMDLNAYKPQSGECSSEWPDNASVDGDSEKSIGSSATGTGTTLPLVYGPIPYKSPRRYVEGEVTIHYRSPVRTEAKEILSEEELARRSAENMRRVYQEERRRKYLQELHDIDSRRHTDNFIPSQKSPIPLNRYDDFVDDLSYRSRSQEQTPEPRLVARAIYNFVGQTSRELSFRRGDIIIIRRQIDKNWYEGEHNAMVGLFPFNYVEILPYDGARSTPKKSYEGQARAKFNFIAQTNLELSLAKDELVVLTRRVDENWYEGRIGNKKGIFPVTYVEVIVEPGQHRPETPVSGKPVASPAAHSMLSNGTASGKLSMGPHHYTPSIPIKTSITEPQYISLPRIGVTERNKLHVAPVNETLHIDTHSDTVPYRALYNYRPQNEDELELKEGDMVYVMEKCDDGWFVGSSQRTGYFGTFPGNYVERL